MWGCCGLCRRAFSDRWRLGPGHSVRLGTVASCQSGRHLAVLPAHLSPGHFPNFCHRQQLHPATLTTPTHTQHTHIPAHNTQAHAHCLSAAWSPSSDSQAGLKRPLASPRWAADSCIGAEYWSTGQALGRGVALGSAPPASEPRPDPAVVPCSFSPHLLGNVSVDCKASYYFT